MGGTRAQRGTVHRQARRVMDRRIHTLLDTAWETACPARSAVGVCHNGEDADRVGGVAMTDQAAGMRRPLTSLGEGFRSRTYRSADGLVVRVPAPPAPPPYPA